tara:strand:- start:80 stop:442 length:363 start_codon:yes stop_codon:yes gene_type:complete
MDGNLLHDAWIVFVAIFSYFFKQFTAKLASLEKEKADSDQINEAVRTLGNKIHEVEKKVDKLGLTSIGRPEYKGDLDKTVEKINAIHLRVNAVGEKLCAKEDRISTIRIEGNDNLQQKKK